MIGTCSNVMAADGLHLFTCNSPAGGLRYRNLAVAAICTTLSKLDPTLLLIAYWSGEGPSSSAGCKRSMGLVAAETWHCVFVASDERRVLREAFETQARTLRTSSIRSLPMVDGHPCIFIRSRLRQWGVIG